MFWNCFLKKTGFRDRWKPFGVCGFSSLKISWVINYNYLFIFMTNKFVMYATSSYLKETRRKGGWRKIVETQFGMKSWFHAASWNNCKIFFTLYLVSIKREPGTQQAHPSKVINFGRPRFNFARKILTKTRLATAVTQTMPRKLNVHKLRKENSTPFEHKAYSVTGILIIDHFVFRLYHFRLYKSYEILHKRVPNRVIQPRDPD